MATYTRDPDNIRPWGGTTADIARVAQEAHRLLIKALPDGSDEGIQFSIDVEQPGREDSYDTAEEFQAGVAVDAESIRRVNIHASLSGYPEPIRLFVYFWLHSGAGVRVTGSNRTLVNGIALSLHEELKKGRRRGGSLRSVTPAIMGAALGATIAALAEASNATPRHHTGALIVLAIAVLLWASAGISALASWAVPAMEMRLPDQPTRLRQTVGSPLGKLGAFLASAVVAGIIGALISKAL